MTAPARRALVLLSVLALLATACRPGEETGGATTAAEEPQLEVRPFSEIQDGPVAFTADPGDPSRGIFRVTTTEEAICAIVWGETDELGRFNNSLAMSGTGIIQHDVILPDLVQGREYVYVLQGSTADGTLYRSEVDTFTIPVTDTAEQAAQEPDLGPNLAEQATVTDVSSEFGAAFHAANAIDGDLTTEWSSRDDGDGAFITIDLAEPTNISGFAFLTRSMADGSAITEEYTVTTDTGEVLGPFPAGSPAQPRISEVGARATALTVEVTRSTGGNVGAVEIQVFGAG